LSLRLHQRNSALRIRFEDRGCASWASLTSWTCWISWTSTYLWTWISTCHLVLDLDPDEDLDVDPYLLNSGSHRESSSVVTSTA